MRNKIVISIVDDNQFARDATGDFVESLGYDVLKFSSAENFLQSGRIAETACVIADLHMPGLNGLELQQRLRAEGHDMPVIFITALPEKQFEDRARNAGAIAFLRKPFDDTDLIGSIELALSHTR